MTNDNDNKHSTIKRTVNSSGVVMCTYVGKPVEIITDVEQGSNGNDDNAEEDELSVYGCSNSNCHSFGEETTECVRCGEDSSCYYVGGEKLTMEQVKDAIKLMEEEDAEEENDTNEDESE